MYRKIFNVMLILAMALSVSLQCLRKADASPSAQDGAKSYIVILANDPIVAYEGDYSRIPGHQT